MAKSNAGIDLVCDAASALAATDTGTSTGTTATTLTDSGKSWTTNVWTGRIVSSGSRFGIVLSNTGTVLTVDRWYDPASPGGAAGSTPATGTYVIVPGNAPGAWMAVTANSTAPSAGNTTLSGEITTAGGALVRSLATYAHTAGTATYTLTKAFTANGTDSLPVTLAKIGIFAGQNAGRMLYETLLSATATLTASGDAVTITDTVTVS